MSVSTIGRRYLWLLMLCAVVFLPDAWHAWQLRNTRVEVDQRLESMDSEFKKYQEQKHRLLSDETYIEGLVRSTFKLARPDEVVIPIRDDLDP